MPAARPTALVASAATASVVFPSGQRELSNSAKAAIEGWLAAIKSLPTRDITIVGYADDLGTAEGNINLALERAQAVKALLETQGVHASQLLVAGSDNQVFGRRVVILVIGDSGSG